MGWSATLQNAYVRNVDVVTRGFSGYTTRDMLPLITPILSTYQSTSPTHPLLLILWLGTNDAVLPGYPQNVPLEDYKANLKSLLTTSKTIHLSLKIIFMTPPPLDVKSLGPPITRSLNSTKTYYKATLSIEEWATQTFGQDVTLLDTWTAMGVTADMDDTSLCVKIRPLLRDGLHLSAKGSTLIGDAILNTIASRWEELQPGRLPQMIVEKHVVVTNRKR
ncbi:isoamyl acetate-hydrolyzing esterase [Phlyctochytrium planicorne]|nr:isoamyl acetate-hydrolyzing esterase [Phlyctochytrium planicorne]